MTTLLTSERIRAASRINRFRGWTRRNYSILEHQVIGALLMSERGDTDEAIRAFLVHDLHETEFVGDIPTPDKARYMPESYYRDVAEWDLRLCDEIGLPLAALDSEAVQYVDSTMAAVESVIVSTGDWTAVYDPTPDTRFITELITSRSFAGSGAVLQFALMWGDLSLSICEGEA